MSNSKSVKSEIMNKHKNKIKELKMSSKGRHIIKPKKLLTTSSDEKMKIKKRLLKRKSINVHDELSNFKSSASQPNILRDITLLNNAYTSKTPNTSNVLSRSISTDDTNLLHNNHAKQSLKYDDATHTHVPTRNLTEVDLNTSFNDQNLQQLVEHDNNLLLKNCNESDSNMSCNGPDSNKSFKNKNLKYNTSHSLSKNCSGPDSNMSCNENLKQSVEKAYEETNLLSKNCSKPDSNMSFNNKNLNRLVEHDTSYSLSNNYTGEGSSTSCNTKNSKVSNENTKTVEPSESINGLEPNDVSLRVIVKLLSHVIEQNNVMSSDIKTLKGQHVSLMENNLYQRPDGFPLNTIEEFQKLEKDKNRLQELLTYLKFVGGIKLREALSHFQKETMTDELTCKFTYWGRKKKSKSFYNTQMAKVYFYAAKMCPNFSGK